MTKIVCPECNTPAYDDTSLFCYKCGAPLPVIQKKKDALHGNFGREVLKKESRSIRDDTPLSRKPVSVSQIKPVEICARCGAPITDKDKVFCSRCTANLLDTPSGEEFPIIPPVVSKSKEKNLVSTPWIYQDAGNKTIKEPEPVPVQEAGNPIVAKTSGWNVILIVAAIAILLFVLMMIVMLMFTFWVSLY